MDREFKTTFIPKKKLAVARKSKGIKAGKPNSLLSLIAWLLFITALVSVIGVYLYKLRVATVVQSRIESINRAEKAFEPSLILELKKLDIRLKASTEILEKHVALSDFFDSFGESTLPEISFTDFNFNFDEKASEVSITGEARGFLPIAQQSDIFEKNRYIKNHIFSNFELTDTGNVSFGLDFTLDPALIKYGRTIQNTQVESGADISKNIISQESQTLPAGEKVDFSDLVNTNPNQ